MVSDRHAEHPYRRRTRRGAFVLSLVVLGLLAQPCVAFFGGKSEKELVKEADAFIAQKPEPLKPFFHTLYMEGEWNAVLNFNLLALAALEIGRHDIAEGSLDQATSRITRVYADDPNAAKAKSLWSAERVKDFKGEPYERAMTFLYRGLLYLREGDFQNARAAFLQADLQNAMGYTERYDRSFALPVYLAAWASACDDDMPRAQDLLATAKKNAVDPFYRAVDATFPRHLTLLERGIGPEKVTLGEAKSILSFLPQPDLHGEFRARYSREGTPITRGVAGNLDWLALTRGGRPIQGILDGKAQFKETAGNVAEVTGTIAGAALYASMSSLGADRTSVAKNLGMLGAGASMVGAMASMLSRSANAEADTRYWGSLPKYFQMEAFGEHGLEVKHFESPHSPKPRPVLVAAKYRDSCTFSYGREISGLDATQGGVGNPSPWPAEPLEDNRTKQNESFRETLRASF